MTDLIAKEKKEIKNPHIHDNYLKVEEILHIGMPHLDIFGLSEQFCLSNSGNCHWSLISELTSKTPTEWRGRDGGRIYASFIYTLLKYSRDCYVDEGEAIRVECRPLALRAPYFVTETNYINSDGDIVASVRLMSAFAQKYENGRNRFFRSNMNFRSGPFGEAIVEDIKRRYRELKAFDDSNLREASEHVVNPAVDFNAANFMYFANYCQLFKRYESPELNATVPIESREIAYFGNVDPFEKIAVLSRQVGMNALSAVVSAMQRSSDQMCIARSFSVASKHPGELADVETGLRNGFRQNTNGHSV